MRRDTRDRIGAYAGDFDRRFLGVSGPEAEVRRLTRQVGVIAVRGEPDAHGDHSVSHTATIVVTDPRARFVAAFDPPHAAASIANRIARIRVSDGR